MEEAQISAKYTLYKDIFTKMTYTLLLSASISLAIWKLVWADNVYSIHTILELGSIIIGISTFLVIWYHSEGENTINSILGFGFLLVGVFDLMHAYYYQYWMIDYMIKVNLASRYWITARLIEVTTLLVFSFFPFYKKGNKYVMITKKIIIMVLCVYFLDSGNGWIPVLYNSKGITSTKVFLEFLVIMTSIFILFKLKNNMLGKSVIRFDYLFICVLIIIPSELCFSLYRDEHSFTMVFGHVLKIASYYYLYKAVFESAVKYPYTKLRENNQRLSDILNAISTPILTYNSNNCVDFVNDKFQEISKYDKDRIIGLNDKELLLFLRKIDNEDENTIPYRINSNKENTTNIIRTYTDGNGEQKKILINAHKIKNGVLLLINDVKQEQEMKNLHLQAQTILNALTSPTMIIDNSGTVTACNNALAKLTGLDLRDIINEKSSKLKNLTKFHKKKIVNKFKAENTTEKVFDAFIEIADGSKKQITGISYEINNIYNENIGWLYSFRDITNEKENQLKLINQEKLVLLGQMGATIVHETRNFLTTIKGNSQLIEIYSKDSKIKEYAKKINTNTDEVNRIITDFLSLSKPRETELLEVAFNDLILSMKGIIETSSLMKGVELILDLNYDERYILCDEMQIRQVILNMCKNAVEAMEEAGNPVLHISTGLNEHNNEVFINVSDNGKGIPKELISKIGTPFFSTKKSGTGLGLNACYQVIKEHKGNIEVKSELGKGTTFIITLPYIEEDIEDII